MHRSRVWRYGTRWDQGSSREEGLLSCIVLPPPTPPTPLAQRFAMHIKISYLRFVILFVVLYCKVLHCRCTYASTSKCVYMRVCMYPCLDRCICASMQILNIYGRGSWVWVDLFAILLLLFNIWQWGFWHIKPFWEDCSILLVICPEDFVSLHAYCLFILKVFFTSSQLQVLPCVTLLFLDLNSRIWWYCLSFSPVFIFFTQ